MPYIENFADALPDSARVAEEKSRLEAAGVKYILSCWIDLLGVPKTKPVPISDFELLCMVVPLIPTRFPCPTSTVS